MTYKDPHGNFPSKSVERRVAEENRTPTGTPREILAWVGTDSERAERALSQELATEKPRKTLVNPLKEIIDNANATTF